MVRLRASSGALFVNLECDHFASCGEEVLNQGTIQATMARARAKGWHIFIGETNGGDQVTWVLGPQCVGRRMRPERPPQVLDGQQSLF